MFAYIVLGLWLILAVPKGELEVDLNRHHTIELDYFFSFITNLGDGNVSVAIIILLFFRKIYYAIFATISFIFSTLVVHFFKRIIFTDMPRPSVFLDKKLNLHYVQGVEIWGANSFPSGHTAGAFAIFLVLAIVYRNKYFDVVFFMLSFLVGLSRVYLLQHFFVDTYFGAIIGVVTTLLVYYFTYYKANWIDNSMLNKSVINLFSPK